MDNIEFNVNGLNQINTLALAELQHIYPQLEKYVGQKINTQSGKSKKFVIEFTGTIKHRCYIDLKSTTIWLSLTICISKGTNGCQYFDKHLSLGLMENDTLTELFPLDITIRDYQLDRPEKVENVRNQLQEYKIAKEKLQAIERDFRLSNDLLKYI